MSHNKKKEVAKSSIRGVDIEFDSERLASILSIPDNNGISEEEEEEEEAQNAHFDWEAVVDEAAVQGESGSDDQFFDAQVDVEEPVAEVPVVPAFSASPGDSTT
ncbi:hypothetical protein Dimus_020515 [Dionaea muscipula]